MYCITHCEADHLQVRDLGQLGKATKPATTIQPLVLVRSTRNTQGSNNTANAIKVLYPCAPNGRKQMLRMSEIALAQGGKAAVDWSEVRTAYETTRTTLRQIADRFGISFSTTMKRAAREKWKKPESVIVETRKKIDGTINKVVEEAAQKMEAAVSLMAENALADIRPWIEGGKVNHIRRIVEAGKRGVERIEKLWNDNEPNDPRDESFAAASLERHDTMVRPEGQDSLWPGAYAPEGGN